MRNPNGYGTVVKLSGTRRNPYAVRKTVGFNAKGYPIYKCIGYTATKAEGLVMLAEYNHNPYDIDLHNITAEEVFNKWLERDAPKMAKATLSAMKSAWKHCENVYKLRYSELKAYQMQECIDKCGRGYSTKGAIKTLFYHLDRYALELDIIQKKNSELITSPPIPETKKQPFTEDEITALWKIQDEPWADSILTLLYMGWRISELLSIRCEDVDLTAKTIIGGTKTESGKNRIIPIHKRILPFIENRYAQNNEYLFALNGKQCASYNYYILWNEIMNRLNQHHTPHECRHTFRTGLDNAGANKKCIDLLMGHKSKDVGERVYTHKTLEDLQKTIALLQ